MVEVVRVLAMSRPDAIMNPRDITQALAVAALSPGRISGIILCLEERGVKFTR